MQILGKVLPFLISPLGGLLGIGKKKAPAPAQVATPLQATRDDARAEIAAADALRRRKGAAADMLTGTRGAEAAGSTGKLVLGN